MKLLSTPQGRSRREQENIDQELRAIELDKLIKEKRWELEDLDRTLIRSLSEKSLKNYEEEQLWQEKLKSLTDEVEALESRRKSALVPLEERERKVEDRDSALSRREELLALKEADNEHKQELLERRLDEVSEREEEATQYALRLNSREFAVQLQEAQVRERMNALTDILRESFGDIERNKAEVAKRKAILKGRDISITERERNVEMQEAAFDRREQAILDKYRSLQKAITETNLKNSVPQQNSTRGPD